jgi:hypothetical protein
MALRYAISNNGLQLLQAFLGLTPHPAISDDLRDVIFVAIDFENLGNIKQDSAQNLDSQVGIAILDTRILASSQLEKTILTYSFATGSTRYCTAATKISYLGRRLQYANKIYLRPLSLWSHEHVISLLSVMTLSTIFTFCKYLSLIYRRRLLAFLIHKRLPRSSYPTIPVLLATSFKRFTVLSISFILLVTMHTSLYEHCYY